MTLNEAKDIIESQKLVIRRAQTRERELVAAHLYALAASACHDPNCVSGWHYNSWETLRHVAGVTAVRVSLAQLRDALEAAGLGPALPKKGVAPEPGGEHTSS